MDDAKRDRAFGLMSVIQHNYPWHVPVVTMGTCAKKCGRPARGGGQCPRCAEEELAELVGHEQAVAFHEAVRAYQRASYAVINAAELNI